MMMLLIASVCLLFIGCAKDEIFPNDLTSKAKQAQKLPDDGEISEMARPADAGCNCEYRITRFSENPDGNNPWQARVYNSGNPNNPSPGDDIESGLFGTAQGDWNTITLDELSIGYPTSFQPFQPSPSANPDNIQYKNLWLQYDADITSTMTMMVHIQCTSGDGNQVGNQYFTVNEPENVSGLTWWSESFCVSCRDIQEGECQTIGSM